MIHRQKKIVQKNLLEDHRVRLVITENLFRGTIIGFIVVVLVSSILWYQFVVWPDPILLACSLIIWCLNAFAYIFLYFHYLLTPINLRQKTEKTILYLKLLTINRRMDYTICGITALILYKTKPDWVLLETIGVIMYYYAGFAKNMPHSALTKYSAIFIFTPLTVAFFISGNLMHVIISIFFLLTIFGMFTYSLVIENIIQLPIKQRFELEDLSKQLNIERERADAANAAKSNFFTAASHDARQPLQVISLLFQSLQKSSQISSQDKTIIDKIDINLKTIRNLFDRVLDISRIDSGNVIPHIQAVQLQQLFDKFDAQFGELAASKGLWLRFVPTTAWVEQDPELLDRILSNLIHNAIKYTQTGGVWVAWRATRGRIEVRDTGLGISAKHQLTIFDEFAQINNPARNNEAGLGLGLSIVKRLADLTQTPIGLVSKLDQGSTFWLRLNKVEKTLTNILNTDDDFSEKKYITNTKPLANLHLLYAEDEPQIRELFSNLLEAAGAIVYVCADVDEAKRYIDNQSLIHLVLTDYRLGESGTGVDIVQYARNQYRIHNNKDNDTLPAIILTGDTAVKDLQSIQQLPHCTLLHKPLDFDRLVAELQAVAQLR